MQPAPFRAGCAVFCVRDGRAVACYGSDSPTRAPFLGAGHAQNKKSSIKGKPICLLNYPMMYPNSPNACTMANKITTTSKRCTQVPAFL